LRSADSGDGSNAHSAVLNPQSYAAYLVTRPPEAEVDAIRLMIRLAGEFRVSMHIVHVSSAEGVDVIASAKAARVPITAETCPHYLTFSAERIPDGATEFKCVPPIRGASHRAALWEGLEDGTIDLIATDHSPAPPSMKTPGNFMTAWGGIASLELTLPAAWTAARARFLVQSSPTGETDLAPEGVARPQAADLARWMSERPAALAGLSEKKGRIAPGLDADLVIWDPDVARAVDPARLKQRQKLTPYAGRTLFGRVLTTFVRGERVWDRKKLVRAYGGSLV
jgi:allantoinase